MRAYLPEPPAPSAIPPARTRRAVQLSAAPLSSAPDPTSPLAPQGPARATPEARPRRILGATALLVLGRLWSSACALLALVVLARTLEGDDFGRFTFYVALFVLLDTLADLGTGAVAVQRTAAAPAELPEVVAGARRIRLAAGAVGAALVGGGAWVLGEPGAGWILLATLYPLSHALELEATVFKNRIAWGVPVAVRVAASSAALLLVLAAVARGVRDPALLLLCQVGGHGLGNLTLFLAARPHLPRRALGAIPWRPLLAAALPLGLAGLCQRGYFYLDNLFVRALEGEVALGHYNVGVRVLSYTVMGAVYASLAALPWLARCHARGQLGAAARDLTQALLALGGLAAGLLWPWTSTLLGLFGPGFEAASTSLRWLLGAAVAIHAGAGLLTAVLAAGRARAVLAIAAAGLGLNALANALLVPAHGIEGAAMATLATELAVASLAAYALTRQQRGALGGRAWAWLGAPALFVPAYLVSSRLGLEGLLG